MADKQIVRITLTPEQQAQVAQQTGRRIAVAEIKPEVLEARVAPGVGMN